MDNDSSPTESPRVSVLMTVFNGAAYLRPAVESVLDQTLTDFEFIIVDDGSQDNSVAIAKEFSDRRIRLVENAENRGQTVCLNQGLKLARGRYVARLDADDLSLPTRLEKQADFLDQQAHVAMVGSTARQIDATGRPVGIVRVPADTVSVRWTHLFDNAFSHSTVMFRRERVLAEFGGYDERFRCSQDYDLWSRIARKAEVANLEEPLVELRAHSGSMMQTQSTRLVQEADQIQRENLLAQFPGRNFSEDEFASLRSFRFRVSPENLAKFRTLWTTLLRDFEDKQSGLHRTQSFRRTLARQRVRIGYNLLETARGSAFSELAAAMKLYPAIAAEVPWARVVALATLGDRARDLFRMLSR